MSSSPLPTPNLLCVHADAIYPASELRRIGLAGHALRQAYRQGLRRVLIGRKAFVLGSDFLKFAERLEPTGDPDDRGGTQCHWAGCADQASESRELRGQLTHLCQRHAAGFPQEDTNDE